MSCHLHQLLARWSSLSLFLYFLQRASGCHNFLLVGVNGESAKRPQGTSWAPVIILPPLHCLATTQFPTLQSRSATLTVWVSSLLVAFLVRGTRRTGHRPKVHFTKIVTSFPFGNISHLGISKSVLTRLQGQSQHISLSVFLHDSSKYIFCYPNRDTSESER